MRVAISVSNKKPTTIVGGTTSVSITNGADLKGTSVKGSDDTIGTAELSGNNITIKGVKAGTFNVVVNATNALSPVTLVVTITNPVTIAVDNSDPAVNVGATAVVKITNFATLQNPKVAVADTATATATLATTKAAGDITITGVKAGSTTMDITADNATKLTLTIKVNAAQLSSIIETKTLGELADNKEATIKAQVLKLNTKAKDGDFTIGNIKDTSADLTGAGNYTGVVNVTFTITPPPKKDFVLSKTTSSVAINATDTITITNIAEIQNAKVVSETPATATATLADGTITIKGIAAGTTKANLTGDNANPASITINVSKIDIKSVLKTTALGELADKNSTTIANAVVAKNTTLKTTDFSVGTITDTTAVITASESSIYTGTQNVSFTIAKKKIVVDNATPKAHVGADVVVTITNAGDITNLKTTSKDPATATATLADNKVTIHGVKIGSTSMDLTGDNATTLSVPITIDAIPLGDVLKVTALGELDNKDAATIKAAAIAKNTDTKLADGMFDIAADPAPNDTTANATGKGNYTGTIAVTYTIKAPAKKSMSAKKGK